MTDPFEPAWRELLLARGARLDGLEGRARVCARRSVAKAITALYTIAGEDHAEGNVLSLIPRLMENSRVSAHVRQIASHFIAPVNTEHELAAGIDLIHEAEIIIRELEKLGST